MAEEVASHDLDAVRQLGAQPRRQAWIDFHGCQRAFKTCERNGERTVARADLDDGSACAGHEFDDAGDDGSVGEEVLAVLMTAVTIGRHWLLREVGRSRAWLLGRPAMSPGRERQKWLLAAVSGCAGAVNQCRRTTCLRQYAGAAPVANGSESKRPQ